MLLFACTEIYKFAKLLSEMKKILIFIANLLVCMSFADAAVRDGTAVSRTKSDKPQTQSRVATTVKQNTARTSVLAPRTPKNTVSRNVDAKRSRAVSVRNTQQNDKKSVISRAGTESGTPMSETRTGAEYNACKTAYFSCMDQFCTLKNDDYRRCSCNDRVFDLIDQRKTLEDANEQLTVFTESLDAVGMTAAQATAMKTASDGENAMTSDKSASKALLQAIMNSIRGEDSNVGGKYSDLNSINIAFDTVNAFGMTDTGQAIAAYNGLALYNAVYPQCRQVVKDNCTNASLQRAITAYLMAVEQDCNTVQTAIDTTKKQLKSAVREGSAMLDLARVENRQKHNSSTLTACINEIEAAVLSEEVCGTNYHKCLDNGEYIDVSTGKPIAGVSDFFKLGELLTFVDGVQAVDQKLSKVNENSSFKTNFENRVKKFAQPALDKCVELADDAWADYLDKALLDIYYAQQDKVAEIKQGCFDFVSSCYVSGNKSITDAMQSLISGNEIVVGPDKIVLNNKICSDYIESCNGMFDDDIIKTYIESQKQTDVLASCRAVVQQCFDKYGGQNYENFYNPYSGVIAAGKALDWFTLLRIQSTDDDSNSTDDTYISVCAQQLTTIDACNDPDIIEQAFGGFDRFIDENNFTRYGLKGADGTSNERWARPTGVATEVYNKILSILSTQCMNVDGRFVEFQNLDNYQTSTTGTCKLKDSVISGTYGSIAGTYGLNDIEDMCPYGYADDVDIRSWGICSCWENGFRRSENGVTTKCVVEYKDGDDKWQKAELDDENKVQIPEQQTNN